jgi:hypothetical protein
MITPTVFSVFHMLAVVCVCVCVCVCYMCVCVCVLSEPKQPCASAIYVLHKAP